MNDKVTVSVDQLFQRIGENTIEMDELRKTVNNLRNRLMQLEAENDQLKAANAEREPSEVL